MAGEEQFEELTPPKSIEELGILVLDGSGSMADVEKASGKKKAEAVEEHLIIAHDSLFARLKGGTRRHEISLALVTFDNRDEKRLDPTELAQLTRDDLSLNLLQEHGGSTAIGRALETAGEIAEQFIASEQRVPRFVTILLMSDGQETENTDPVGVAKQIHQKAKPKQIAGRPTQRPDIAIAVAAYGDDADVNTLRQIATQLPDQADKFFKRVQSGTELRAFFLESLTVAPEATGGR